MTSQLIDLLEESRQRGFLGPGPVDVHVDHARAFAVPVPVAPERALDLGAGGGLPGLVLAATMWPTTRWTFLDAQLRRTSFLREAVDALGLDERVEVLTERAEVVGRSPGHRGAYDLVVARSFGSPAVVAECAAPLLCPGGLLVVSEPPDVDVAERWPTDGVGLVGFGPARALVVDGEASVHLAVLELAHPCGDRFPRRTGQPSKRPLF